MGVYLYCMAAPDHAGPQDVAGIGGAAVISRAMEGFSLWVSELDSAPTASLDRIREHNAVIERACESETVVPVRFGQWFQDERRLAEELAGRTEALTGALRRIRGRWRWVSA